MIHRRQSSPISSLFSNSGFSASVKHPFLNCTAGHHCSLYKQCTLFPLDPPWDVDPNPEPSSQPGCPSSSSTPACLSPANALSLEENRRWKNKEWGSAFIPSEGHQPPNSLCQEPAPSVGAVSEDHHNPSCPQWEAGALLGCLQGTVL